MTSGGDPAAGRLRAGENSRPSIASSVAPGRSKMLAVCGLLLLAVGLVFGQTAAHDFVNVDDDTGLVDNRHVSGGLTADGIGWAFTGFQSNTWVPLTWLSHMLDCELWQLRPAGHHLVNVLLHAGGTVVLFWVLARMTGSLWPSALATALFAIHPLRAESVGWVTERKDVLSGLCFALTLAAYLGYVRKRGEGRGERGCWLRRLSPLPSPLFRYLTVMVLLALGLMAKPMLVTLPLVLLLLDYWPLGRMAGRGERGEGQQRQGDSAANRDSLVSLSPCLLVSRSCSFSALLVEKIPLLAVVAASSAVTYLAAGEAGTVETHSLPWRAAYALVSYVVYLGRFFFPVGLTVLYPRPGVDLPEQSPGWQPLGALLLLAGITAGVLAARRTRPYLAVGWLWYLATLLPVIGLVRFGYGAQWTADRFTYLPQIGLAVALAWGAAGLLRGRLRETRRAAGALCAAIAVVALMVLAWRQTSYWRNSGTLWTRALRCNPRNSLAHRDLGVYLAQQGRLDEAMEQYRQVLAIDPTDARTHYNIGLAYYRQDKLDEAARQYQVAINLEPKFVEAYNDLGNVFLKRGRFNESIRQFREVLKIDPGSALAENGLGAALFECGKLGEAIDHFQQALRIWPGYPNARRNLDEALRRRRLFELLQSALAAADAGRFGEAIADYRRAVATAPSDVLVQNNLAWLLATCPDASLRNGAEAAEIAERARRLSNGQEAKVLDTLAAAYAEAGRFPEAIAVAERARELALEKHIKGLANELQDRIRRYRAGEPYHQART